MFNDLEKLAGLVVFCSKTSPIGLTNAYYILKKLAEGHQESTVRLELEDEVMEEIEFWTNTRHIIKMQSLETTGFTIKIYEKEQIKKAKIELDNCTDASTKAYCAKINGIAKFGKSEFKIMTEKELGIR